MNFFSKPPTVKEQVRETDRQLRRTGRDVERERRELERQEKKLINEKEMDIKIAAKAGNKQVCTVLAKQLVQLRKQKERTYAANSKIQAIGSQTKAMASNAALAGAMSTATESLAGMNKLMKPQELAKTMQDFEKANMHMNMTDDIINDTLDDILNESGDEEESEAVVQQVLDEIGIDISAKVARAPAAQGGKLGVASASKVSDEDLEQQLAKLLKS